MADLPQEEVETSEDPQDGEEAAAGTGRDGRWSQDSWAPEGGGAVT